VPETRTRVVPRMHARAVWGSRIPAWPESLASGGLGPGGTIGDGGGGGGGVVVVEEAAVEEVVAAAGAVEVEVEVVVVEAAVEEVVAAVELEVEVEVAARPG
jgi:hypothetical protein